MKFRRGLQAQRKPTNNLKIMFSALRRRAPVMTNRHESERIVRERTQIPQNSKYVVFPSLAEGASQYFKYEKQSLFAYRDVTRYLVRGYEESTESLLKLVAVRCFVFDEPNSWFNADNHVFESYLKLSHLERVRLYVYHYYTHSIRCVTNQDLGKLLFRTCNAS